MMAFGEGTQASTPNILKPACSTRVIASIASARFHASSQLRALNAQLNMPSGKTAVKSNIETSPSTHIINLSQRSDVIYKRRVNINFSFICIYFVSLIRIKI